jgi:hypothetical protein
MPGTRPFGALSDGGRGRDAHPATSATARTAWARDRVARER